MQRLANRLLLTCMTVVLVLVSAFVSVSMFASLVDHPKQFEIDPSFFTIMGNTLTLRNDICNIVFHDLDLIFKDLRFE